MKKQRFLPLLLILTIFSSCSEDDALSSEQTDISKNYSLDGYIQKGPFITGTTVEINELDSALNSTGKVFSTQITNDFGSFKISCTSDQEYAELVADGYYFDEVEGELSDGKLSLRAISKMEQSTNINILTTLQVDRMKYLIQNGQDYDDALSLSKSEVLKVFNIEQAEVNNFTSMNITEQGASNSILLAISSILQNDRSVAEMSELIAKLSLDIADNGIVDNSSLTDKIVESSKQINVAEIIRNLEQRYSDLGIEVTIDNFYDFIDSDADGVLNGSSPYLFVDQSSYIVDYVNSRQVIYFSSNYTPTLHILSDESFAEIVSIDGSKVTLEFAENLGKQNRTMELQFISENGDIAETVYIEQYSSYSEVKFSLIFDMNTRSSLLGTDIEVDRITMIAFDSNGDLLFNNTDDAPEINNGEYKLYLKFIENYYENCTLYTIINSDDDYSNIIDITTLEQLKCNISDNVILSAQNEGVGFSSGRQSYDENGYEMLMVDFGDIFVFVQYAGCSKISFELQFEDNTSEIESFKLEGQIFTNTYLFNESTDGLDMVSSVEIDTESLSSILAAGSTINAIEITLKNGNVFRSELSQTLASGTQYDYAIFISNTALTTQGGSISEWDESIDSSVDFSTTTDTTR